MESSGFGCPRGVNLRMRKDTPQSARKRPVEEMPGTAQQITAKGVEWKNSVKGNK